MSIPAFKLKALIVNEIKLGQITSSAATASSSPKMALGYATISGIFDGQPVSSSDVVVKYTLAGDANLDGSVDFGDLLAVAQHYNGTDTNWQSGDFNYDGTTNFADLLGLAQNYGQTSALSGQQISKLDAAAGVDFATLWSQAQATVPEPVGLFAIALVPLASWRRRVARPGRPSGA